MTEHSPNPGTDPSDITAPAVQMPKFLVLLEGAPSASPKTEEFASKPEAPKPSAFKRLPKELVFEIASFLSHRLDLSNFQKAMSKDMKVFLAPLLYKKMSILLDAPLEASSFNNLFAQTNENLKLIRELDIKFVAWWMKQCGRTGHEVVTDISDILDALPCNQLSRFRLHTYHKLSPGLQSKLWKTQTKLQHMDIYPSNATVAMSSRGHADEQDSTVDLATTLRSLYLKDLRATRVIPNTAADAALVSIILEKECVTELEVDALHWDAQDEFAPVTNQDGTVQDQLTTNLFAHVHPVAPSSSLPGRLDRLTKLCLKYVDLTLCKHTWFTFISLPQLTGLELDYCQGADIFLLHAYDTPCHPKLQVFSLVHDLGGQPDRTVHAVNELLRYSRNTLRTLILCLRNASQLPDVGLIGSSTLKTLSFDISRVSTHLIKNDPSQPVRILEQLIYSRKDFGVLIASCPNVTQLAIAFPVITLEYKVLKKRHPLFCDYMETVANCLRLTALNITNFPVGYHIGLGYGQIAAKDAVLLRLSTDVFDMFTSPNLRDSGSIVEETFSRSIEVLAFGVRDHDIFNIGPRYFLPSESRVVGMPSWTCYTSEPCFLAELRREAMDLDVLDYEKREFDVWHRKILGDVDYDDEEEDSRDSEEQSEDETDSW